MSETKTIAASHAPHDITSPEGRPMGTWARGGENGGVVITFPAALYQDRIKLDKLRGVVREAHRELYHVDSPACAYYKSDQHYQIELVHTLPVEGQTRHELGIRNDYDVAQTIGLFVRAVDAKINAHLFAIPQPPQPFLRTQSAASLMTRPAATRARRLVSGIRKQLGLN